MTNHHHTAKQALPQAWAFYIENMKYGYENSLRCNLGRPNPLHALLGDVLSHRGPHRSHVYHILMGSQHALASRALKENPYLFDDQDFANDFSYWPTYSAILISTLTYSSAVMVACQRHSLLLLPTLRYSLGHLSPHPFYPHPLPPNHYLPFFPRYCQQHYPLGPQSRLPPFLHPRRTQHNSNQQSQSRSQDQTASSQPTQSSLTNRTTQDHKIKQPK
mmetsp:Transcript_35960/g.57481  ORF Transcript_35960/g.57481 Transcript_35960/m.57481 type:complete len:218 (+) Transcript_35960:680-1333(+)